MTLSTVKTDLFQSIVNSWDGCSELQTLIQQLKTQKEDIKGYIYVNQQLKKHVKLVVGPATELRKEILQLWHESPSAGHSGIDNTYRRVSSLFYWKTLKEDVTIFVKNCSIRQKNKYDASAYPGLVQPLKITSTAWSHISMDFIEGLPKSLGKTVIWVVVDRLTKYGHVIALSHPYTANDVAKLFMEHIFKLHGMPEDIVSDRDPVFTSKLWQELFSIQGVTLSTSTAYHPQSDGKTEVLNGCLETYLQCFCSDSPTSWAN